MVTPCFRRRLSNDAITTPDLGSRLKILKNGQGGVLIVESDTDIIGLYRRWTLCETCPEADGHTFLNQGHAPMFTQQER
jgi:hypothetical protein